MHFLFSESFQFLEQAFTSASVYLRIGDCISLCSPETILCIMYAYMHTYIFAEHYMLFACYMSEDTVLLLFHQKLSYELELWLDYLLGCV